MVPLSVQNIGMSPNSFVAGLSPQPAPSVARLIEAVLGSTRAVELADGDDPMAIAARSHLPVVDTLAALGALLTAKMGEFFIRVVDEDGATLREYPSLEDVEAVIVDDFATQHRVDPQQTHVLFRASPALLSYLRSVG